MPCPSMPQEGDHALEKGSAGTSLRHRCDQPDSGLLRYQSIVEFFATAQRASLHGHQRVCCYAW